MQTLEDNLVTVTSAAAEGVLASLWETVCRWSWLGTKPSDSASHKRKIMQVNVGAFIVIATLVVFTALHWMFQPHSILTRIVSWQWLPASFIPIVWWLNAKRRPLAACLALTLVAMIATAVAVCMGQGNALNCHGYFALFAVVIPIFYDTSRPRLIMFMSIINLALFIAFQFGLAPIHPDVAALPIEVRIILSNTMMAMCLFTVVVLLNINEWWSVRNERQLVALATTDALTGLLNRRHFHDLFEVERERALRDNSPLALAILDLDHFKRVNDSLGHDGGDAALIHVCNAITAQLRPYDALARLGGEEFGLLLTRMNDRSLPQVAERLRQAVEHSNFTYHGRPYRLTVSIGVVKAPPKAPLTQLIQQADAALYRAKAEGRNCIREHRDELA